MFETPCTLLAAFWRKLAGIHFSLYGSMQTWAMVLVAQKFQLLWKRSINVGNSLLKALQAVYYIKQKLYYNSFERDFWKCDVKYDIYTLFCMWISYMFRWDYVFVGINGNLTFISYAKSCTFAAHLCANMHNNIMYNITK